MQLDFELKIRRTTASMVIYDVSRKGLVIGIMAIDRDHVPEKNQLEMMLQ